MLHEERNSFTFLVLEGISSQCCKNYNKDITQFHAKYYLNTKKFLTYYGVSVGGKAFFFGFGMSWLSSIYSFQKVFFFCCNERICYWRYCLGSHLDSWHYIPSKEIRCYNWILLVMWQKYLHNPVFPDFLMSSLSRVQNNF